MRNFKETSIASVGNISVKNSGPGAWTSGNNLAVGEGATFVFPVKDAFNNVKKRSTGAASQAEFEQAFGQFDARIRNHVHSLSMNYNTETGYANVTFIPTTLGTWPLFLGKEEELSPPMRLLPPLLLPILLPLTIAVNLSSRNSPGKGKEEIQDIRLCLMNLGKVYIIVCSGRVIVLIGKSIIPTILFTFRLYYSLHGRSDETITFFLPFQKYSFICKITTKLPLD